MSKVKKGVDQEAETFEKCPGIVNDFTGHVNGFTILRESVHPIIQLSRLRNWLTKFLLSINSTDFQ